MSIAIVSVAIVSVAIVSVAIVSIAIASIAIVLIDGRDYQHYEQVGARVNERTIVLVIDDQECYQSV